MTREEALRIGFPVEWLPTDLTVEEACLETCEDCGAVMNKHSDARWRVKIRPIRCKDCTQVLIDRGFDPFEARFVS